MKLVTALAHRHLQAIDSLVHLVTARFHVRLQATDSLVHDGSVLIDLIVEGVDTIVEYVDIIVEYCMYL